MTPFFLLAVFGRAGSPTGLTCTVYLKFSVILTYFSPPHVRFWEETRGKCFPCIILSRFCWNSISNTSSVRPEWMFLPLLWTQRLCQQGGSTQPRACCTSPECLKEWHFWVLTASQPIPTSPVDRQVLGAPGTLRGTPTGDQAQFCSSSPGSQHSQGVSHGLKISFPSLFCQQLLIMNSIPLGPCFLSFKVTTQ